MNIYGYQAGADPFVDAIALVYAQMQGRTAAVQLVLDRADLVGLAVVLGQMLQTAVRTQGMTVEQFLDMQTEKTLEAIREDGESDAA